MDEKASIDHPELGARLARLAAQYLPVFTQPGFAPASIQPTKAAGDGMISMPALTYDSRVDAFVEAVEGIRRDLGLPHGSAADAQRWFDNPATIDAAEPAGIWQLLQAIMRGERFMDGAVADAIDNGILPRLLARAAAL